MSMVASFYFYGTIYYDVLRVDIISCWGGHTGKPVST